MKKLIFAVLLSVSASAYAGMWSLVHSEFVAGTGWICTYQLQGTNYTATIISRSYCQMFVNQ